MALCVHQSPQHNTDAGVFQYHRIAIEFGFGLGREWIGKAAFRILGVISNFTATRIFPVNFAFLQRYVRKTGFTLED